MNEKKNEQPKTSESKSTNETWGEFKFLMVDGKEFVPTTLHYLTQTGAKESIVVLARADY